MNLMNLINSGGSEKDLLPSSGTYNLNGYQPYLMLELEKLVMVNMKELKDRELFFKLL